MDDAKASFPSIGAGARTGNERTGLRDNEDKGTMPCIGRCLEVSDMCRR